MITRGLASFAGALTIGLAILTSSGLSGVLQVWICSYINFGK
jgi:hypothetical protein